MIGMQTVQFVGWKWQRAVLSLCCFNWQIQNLSEAVSVSTRNGPDFRQIDDFVGAIEP
jgi:hypothetical protein